MNDYILKNVKVNLKNMNKRFFLKIYIYIYKNKIFFLIIINIKNFNDKTHI